MGVCVWQYYKFKYKTTAATTTTATATTTATTPSYRNQSINQSPASQVPTFSLRTAARSDPHRPPPATIQYN